jgi:hypothetical protein
MEFVAKPIALKHETKELLDEIRASSEPTAAYALGPDEAEELFKHITEPMLEGCPLPITVINQMRWYVRELSAKFRTRYGYALSFQLELVLRKWAAFGMEPNTMQYLLCEVYRQLKSMGKPGLYPGMPEAGAVPGLPEGADPGEPDAEDSS